jgi:hypothetical protein
MKSLGSWKGTAAAYWLSRGRGMAIEERAGADRSIGAPGTAGSWSPFSSQSAVR